MNSIKNPKQPTRGPWTLHPRVREDPPHIYAHGVIVATVDTSAPDPGEREANAALIAAAPALREAAEARLSEWHADSRNMERKEPESVKLARAALKAAGGESP